MTRLSMCERWGHLWGWPEGRTLLSTCSACGATRDGKLIWLDGYSFLALPSKEQGYIQNSGYAAPPFDLTPPEEPAR